MTGATTELNLATAQDSDDTENYLTVSLTQALAIVDALFNASTGHDHSAAHKGPQIPTAGIANLAVTSAKIANAAVGPTQLATAAVTQNSAANLGSDFSTTSTSLVDVTGATVSLTTQGGDVLVFACGPGHATTQNGQLRLNMDGVDVSSNLVQLVAGGDVDGPWTIVYKYGTPAAGSHTWKLRALAVSGGTTSLRFGTVANGFLMAVELKR